MPATTSLFIDKYHPKSDGTCAVSVRVTFERKKKYYPTGKSYSVLDFDRSQGDKPRNEYKVIALKLQAFEQKAANIIDKLPSFTFKAFEKQYFTNRGTKDAINTAFKNYSRELRQAGRIGTAVSYECAQNSLNNFNADTKFSEVTPEFLHKYEKWMLGKGNSITTVGIYLRNLRALFNIAIADGVLAKDYYPFGKKRYEIPTGNNIKKALSLKDIGSIFYYKCETGSNTDKYKDYWIFMYLCNGINVKDMCLLEYENIKDDIIVFERAKTIRTKRNVEPIRISISPDITKIIEKWGNKPAEGKSFIFPILEKGLTPERERQLIQQETKLINTYMKSIAKELGIKSDLTTYVARHSFSTVLKRSGASTEVISEALGHGSLKTTKAYLDSFEDESKREIMKALIAFEK